ATPWASRLQGARERGLEGGRQVAAAGILQRVDVVSRRDARFDEQGDSVAGTRAGRLEGRACCHAPCSLRGSHRNVWQRRRRKREVELETSFIVPHHARNRSSIAVGFDPKLPVMHFPRATQERILEIEAELAAGALLAIILGPFAEVGNRGP